MKAFKKIAIATILVGTISIALILLFNDQNISVLIHKETIGNTTLTWYKFDWVLYKDNLTTAINHTSNLQLQMPVWYATDTDVWAVNVINGATNTLNAIIMIVNILLYPLKVGGYLIYFLLAIFGINVQNGSSLQWLGDFSNNLISLTIAYQ